MSNFKNAVRGAKSPRAAVAKLRSKLRSIDIEPCVRWILSVPPYRQSVFPEPFPRRDRDLKWAWPFAPIRLVDEVNWLGALLKSYAPAIELFLRVRGNVESALLKNDATSVKEQLADARNSLGFSFSLLQLEIGTASLQIGEDEAREVLQGISIQDQSLKFCLLRWLDKAGGRTSRERLVADLSEVFAAANIEGPYGNFLSFQILDTSAISQRYFEDLLRWASALPPIDAYELFVRATASANHRLEDGARAALSRLATHLSTDISDTRLVRLAEELGRAKSRTVVHNAPLLNVASLARSEQFDLALASILELDVEPKRDWVALAGLVASYCADPGPSIASSERPESWLVSLIASALSARPSADSAQAELERVSGLVHLLPMGPLLGTLGALASAPTSFLDELPGYARSQILEGGANSLRLLFFFDPASFATEDPGATALSATNAMRDPPLAAAALAYQEREFETAARLARSVANRTTGALHRDAMRLLSRALLRRDDAFEAAREIVRELLRENSCVLQLPIRRTAEALQSLTTDDLQEALAAAIVLDFATRHVLPDLWPGRNDAIEHFLRSAEVSKFSELSRHSDRLDIPSLDYFLRSVCSVEVIGMCLGVHQTIQALDERKAVCEALLRLSPEREEETALDIREVVGRLLVARRMREVEGSKISVDSQKILEVFASAYSGLYARYCQLAQARWTGGSAQIRVAIAEAVKTGEFEQLGELRAPKDEPGALLASLITSLRDEYVSNSTYGLDGFLSIRVRHGTLIGQLRRPLEERHLVTRKDELGKYERSRYWTFRLAGIDDQAGAQIEDRLLAFSNDFDALCSEIVAKWIQVKKQPSGTGCFDMTIPDMVFALASEQTDAPIEVFAESVIRWLDERLAHSLREVRRKIQEELKPRIAGLLEALSGEIRQISRTAAIGDFTNSVLAAHTSLQQECDRISEWFKIGGVGASEPFTLADAVRISEESISSVRKIHVDILVDEGSQTPIRGIYLPPFVDILATLFDNVTKHSKLETPTIRVEISSADSLVLVRLSNQLGSSCDVRDIEQKLLRIGAQMASEQAAVLVTKEGGSGLVKVWHTLRNHIDPGSTFIFRTEQRSFVAEFTFKLKQPLVQQWGPLDESPTS